MRKISNKKSCGCYTSSRYSDSDFSPMRLIHFHHQCMKHRNISKIKQYRSEIKKLSRKKNLNSQELKYKNRLIKNLRNRTSYKNL